VKGWQRRAAWSGLAAGMVATVALLVFLLAWAG
jgi:tetrahydromethanopterin S-methyltransferase subunit F